MADLSVTATSVLPGTTNADFETLPAGGIAPAADLTTGHYTSVVGVGITAATLGLAIYNSGVAVP